MFRLDSVLRHKEVLEREARVVRVVYERRADEMESSLKALRRERSTLPEGDAEAAGEDRVRELREWAGYAEGLRKKELSLERRLADFRPQLEEKARIHTAIRQEVEGLRKLRERELLRRRKDRERKLQETIDDAAGRRRFPAPGTDFRVEAVEAEAPGHSETPESRPEREMNPDRGTGR